MSRESRIVATGERRWRALEAWRGRGDVGLLYFVALDDGADRESGAEDRRARLEPGEGLAALDEEELRRRLESGTSLTATERRFRAPDDRLWLAQSSGPVWAEEGVASGLTGVVFTALEGEPRRLGGDGGHVGEMSTAELEARWRAAGGRSRDADEPEPGL